jgi:AbrB family looped-hinge helix DNA binding protein
MANTNQVAAKIDNKGRVTLPKNIRVALGVEIGDTVFLKYEPEDKQVHLARAISPFDILAEHAVKEYLDGRTKTIEEFTKEQNIPQ